MDRLGLFDRVLGALGGVTRPGGELNPSFRADLMSSLIAQAWGDPTPTFTRATTKKVWGYGPTAVLGVDDPVLLTCASGEAGFTGARRISEGVWSSYDANGVFLSTTNGASALYGDAYGPYGYNPEGARTNLCLHSEDLTNAAYTKSAGTTITANAATAPDGTTTADLVTEGAGGAFTNFVYQSITGTADANYAVSVYVKYVDTQWVFFDVFSGANEARVWFDIQNGVVGSQTLGGTATVVSKTIEPAANGYYRLKLVANVGSGLTAIRAYWSSATADGSTTTVAGGRYQWGHQFEDAASFASSYIPTTTASVARNIDVEQYVSAGNLNSAAMTIALDWTPEAASMGPVFLFGTYVDASNYTAVLHDGTNIIARKRIGGANHDATKALTYVAGTKYRIAARFDGTNGCDIWVDGTKGTNDNTTTASQIGTNFQVGADGNGANSGFGSVRRFAAYNRGLSDASAAAL